MASLSSPTGRPWHARCTPRMPGPGERLGDPAALGHHQDDRLLGGEPPPTLRARPPTADRGAVVGGPAVDDPAVRIATERTVHAITSPAARRVLRFGLRTQPV